MALAPVHPPGEPAALAQQQKGAGRSRSLHLEQGQADQPGEDPLLASSAHLVLTRRHAPAANGRWIDRVTEHPQRSPKGQSIAVCAWLLSRTGGHVVRPDERHRGFCSGPPASSSRSTDVAAGAATKEKPWSSPSVPQRAAPVHRQRAGFDEPSAAAACRSTRASADLDHDDRIHGRGSSAIPAS